ncbi:hypothetical protein C6401_15165 [Arthrobacter woluwensis]|uniref:hypothetical protein n=1 Tax=Arthrobacter woluwensis TaxID=156980 RepID=UPI000D1196CE|nr:hypothetical protein [Arthrobacter woluwensis]PSS42897.1 hypothetical protein C6401_15165 [Arthrobacter woluwensis]
MNNHLVFAVSPDDAKERIQALGLVFDETQWVMNVQLLGGADFTGHTVHYTDLFKSVPAYHEAVSRFGEEGSHVA